MQFLRVLERMLTAKGALGSIPKTDTAFQVSNKQVLPHNCKTVSSFIEDRPHHLKFIIHVIDLYLSFCLLAVPFVEEISAYELSFIQDGQFLHLERLLLVGEVKIRPQFAGIDGN